MIQFYNCNAMLFTLQGLQQPLAIGHMILNPKGTSQGKRGHGAGGRGPGCSQRNGLSAVCDGGLISRAGLGAYSPQRSWVLECIRSPCHGEALSLKRRGFRFHNTGDPGPTDSLTPFFSALARQDLPPAAILKKGMS